jgi:hypothetical protein
VAVTYVAELIVTVSGDTPPNDALATYPEVKKFVPVKIIELPEIDWEVTDGIDVDVA